MTDITAPRPRPVYFIVEGVRHRGYRDASGRFTLEQCNLAKANLAGNLEEYAEGERLPEGESVDFWNIDACDHCWPKE